MRNHFFWHKEDDKEELIRENAKLRETNLKLERNIVQLQSGAEKLRAAYSKAGPRSSLFGKTRDVIQAEQQMKSFINKMKVTPRQHKSKAQTRKGLTPLHHQRIYARRCRKKWYTGML